MLPICFRLGENLKTVCFKMIDVTMNQEDMCLKFRTLVILCNKSLLEIENCMHYISQGEKGFICSILFEKN